MTGAAEERLFFQTGEGTTVPAITAEEMRTVDRIAMEEYGLGILQMMENAGRNLAENAIEMLGAEAGTITVLAGSDLVVDALIGYSLKGAPRGGTAELIELCNRLRALTLALDVPSGLDATTGATPGVAVVPDRTLTLALPKTGLIGVSGELYLADIGIPPNVYKGIGFTLEPFFGDRYWIQLSSVIPGGSDP